MSGKVVDSTAKLLGAGKVLIDTPVVQSPLILIHRCDFYRCEIVCLHETAQCLGTRLCKQ